MFAILSEIANTFVCMHLKQTFPITLNGKTTVSCPDCGAEFEYDWLNTKRGRKLRSTLNTEKPQ
jgi:4-hydroxy-3-methylbut-2-en-1-yl diphosphate synthase IspG/GcpE